MIDGCFNCVTPFFLYFAQKARQQLHIGGGGEKKEKKKKKKKKKEKE